MASDTRNVKLGVCTVHFDGQDLGYTKGGVEVEVATETKKIMVDQFGNSEINEIIMGRTCKARVPLAETTLENLAKIMPGATLVTQGGGVAASGTVTFATAAAANNDTITVNGVVFTYKTTPTPNSNEMAIPATVNAAATEFAAKVNASIDARVSRVTATVATAVVTLTADDGGTAGNAITLAKSGTNITVSGATLSGGTDATTKKITATNGIGVSLLDAAKRLVLHPTALDDDDRSEDFVMPLAMTPGAINFAYKFDEERVFNVEFTAYPDPDTKILFVVGDEDAVES